MKKEVFTVKVNDKDVEFAVVSPNTQQMHKAQLHYNKLFAESLQNGAILRAKLYDYMRKQNLWDDDKQKEYDECMQAIDDGEKKLSKGQMKKSEGREVALSLRHARNRLQGLVSNTIDLHSSTAEGVAENGKFNFLVSLCTVNNADGTSYFKDLQDYEDKWQQADPVTLAAANHFANIYYGLTSDNERKLPENQFLTKYGYVDDKLRLINKEGKLVDFNGKLIDEFGRYVNEEGQIIDDEGNPIDETGAYKSENPIFYDD